MIGFSLANLGRHDEGQVFFREVIELDPSCDEAYFRLGVDLLETDDLIGAVEAFRKVIELNPDDLAAHNNLSRCFTT